MDLCIYLYHTLPHLRCWKQASHPCMASPPDHCCLRAWRKKEIASEVLIRTTRRIKVCPSHQHCLSCPNTGILRAWQWDEVSSRIRKVSTVSWKRGKLTCLHFKAPFTQRVVPKKLPECLLCESKHIPGLISGSILVWGPNNTAGISPGTRRVWTKGRTYAVRS